MMDLSRFDNFPSDEKWTLIQDTTWPFDYSINHFMGGFIFRQNLCVLSNKDTREITNSRPENKRQHEHLELATTAPELLAELKRERELSARFKNALEKIVNDFESIKKSDGCYGDRATAFAWTAQIALGDPQKEAPATPAPDKIELLKELHDRLLVNLGDDLLSEAEKVRIRYIYGYGSAVATFIDSPKALELALGELWTAYQQALTEAGV